MKKERFIISILLIASSILFIFLGVIMVVIFNKSKSEYPKQDVILALSSIIAWGVTWFAGLIAGILMMIKGNEPLIALKTINKTNNNNIDSEAK